MEIIGYLSAIIMGAVLGLIGGGGSILTVPILVYILDFGAVEATGYSLFIVGTASLVGSFDYYKRGLVNFHVGAVFATPALLSVYAVRKFVVPSMPEILFQGSPFSIEKGTLILSVFALVMLAAALTMIRGKESDNSTTVKKLKFPLIGLEGVLVGGVAGFVGAGGGFLIIPVLVTLAGLKMKVAIGTSLLIIAINSLIGFMGDVQVMNSVAWSFLLVFTAFSILGIFLGSSLSKRIPNEKLKPGFGWFVLIMGIGILSKELLF